MNCNFPEICSRNIKNKLITKRILIILKSITIYISFKIYNFLCLLRSRVVHTNIYWNVLIPDWKSLKRIHRWKAKLNATNGLGKRRQMSSNGKRRRCERRYSDYRPPSHLPHSNASPVSEHTAETYSPAKGPCTRTWVKLNAFTLSLWYVCIFLAVLTAITDDIG